MDVWLEVGVYTCNATFGLLRQDDCQGFGTGLSYKMRPLLKFAGGGEERKQAGRMGRDKEKSGESDS